MYVKWQISIIKTLGGDFDTKLCLDKKKEEEKESIIRTKTVSVC